MTGKLYGVGVGPGDPKLLTLQAKEIIESADVIAVPIKASGEESRALNIVAPVTDLTGKEIMPVVFAMENSTEKREICRKAAAEQIQKKLDSGKNVVMAVLGDISVYSTYHQVYKYIKDRGYRTETIPGITSFSAGAAMAEISLTEGGQNMMVMSSMKGMEALTGALEICDNIVVMKAGSLMKRIVSLLEERGLLDKTLVLSNVGMENEYVGPAEAEREYGYFTTLIIKKGGL